MNKPVDHSRQPAALPMQTLDECNIRVLPDSIDKENRTVKVVFTTGASVRRMRWVGWDAAVPFDEVLTVSRDAIDLSRLNAGAPALDSHSMYSTYSQVGVVERAWVENDEGLALIRFPSAGTDAAADRMWGLVSQGIIRNVSVGYRIDRARVVEAEKKGEVEKRIVERWTPHEISFVTVPADAGAQVRSAEIGASYPIEIVGRSAADMPATADTAAAAARMRMDALSRGLLQ